VAAADAGARFAGRLVLLLPSGRRLGSAALRIGPGATRAVRVRVPARVARTLRRRRVQQVTVAVSRGGFLRSIGTLPVVA